MIAASDSSDQIYLMDFVSRTIERISPERFDPDGLINAVAFSPDGNSLAVQSRTIRIINLKTLEQVVVYDGHGNESFWDIKGARAMTYASHGELIASGGTDGMVKIWDASSGREITSWAAHETGVRAIAISSAGNMVATSGGDGFIRLWDRTTGAELGAIERCCKLGLSDDGKLLAITSPTHAELWHMDRGSPDTTSGRNFTLEGPVDMIILPFFQEHPMGEFLAGTFALRIGDSKTALQRRISSDLAPDRKKENCVAHPSWRYFPCFQS